MRRPPRRPGPARQPHPVGRGAALLRRLDRHVEEHHRAVEAAYGAQRTERLMRELERLVESLD